MANKGIQKGQVATDALARKLDYQCKHQSKKLYERLSSCLLYTSPSPRDRTRSRMPSSA